MKDNQNSSTPAKLADSQQAKEKLAKYLDAYDVVAVPDISDIMAHFKHNYIVIYGAGSYGAATYQTFAKYGVKVNLFLDIKAQPGDTLFEIPVHRADDQLLDVAMKADALVVTAIVTDYESRQSIFNFIRECGFNRFMDAQSIRCHLVHYDNQPVSDTRAEHVIKQAAQLLNCFDLLSDEDSKLIYCTNAIAHMGRKYDDCIESRGSVQYFPNDIPFNKGYRRVIDCGGYLGDTIDQLVRIKGEIEAVAVFEPDMANFGKLSLNMDQYTSRIPELYLWPCAVSNKTQPLFMECMGGSSRITPESNGTFVQCVSLDDVLKNFNPTFLKMDVEGEEKRAIIGAEQTIRRCRPDLAISVYHCINHLWDIPLLIASWDLGYQFHLRVHNSYTMETVLYASSNRRGE